MFWASLALVAQLASACKLYWLLRVGSPPWFGTQRHPIVITIGYPSSTSTTIGKANNTFASCVTDH